MLTLTGCINLEKEQPSPQTKKVYIIKLNKEVQELNAEDKQHIYKSIKKGIAHLNKKGNNIYRYGYYYDAIKAYELVNSYAGYYAIPLSKINNMKTIAKVKSKEHYINARRYIAQDKKKALQELNTVMMNNPHYKDTKKLYTALKNESKIRIFINSLENKLERQLVNNTSSFTNLKSIQKSLDMLAKYDYKNKSVQRARKLLEKERSILVQAALKTYNQGKLHNAKQKFLQILSLYPNDAKAKAYLKKIAFKQSKKENLFQAHKYLQQNEYLTAINYAKKVLQLEPHNVEAKNIIKSAKKKAKEAVAKYVYEGKVCYNNKNLDKAKHCFEKALKIDKTNNTSLIYHKKIQRQLQTIKSLQ